MNVSNAHANTVNSVHFALYIYFYVVNIFCHKQREIHKQINIHFMHDEKYKFVLKPYDFRFIRFLVKIFRIFIFGNPVCMHTNSRTRTIIIIHLWCVCVYWIVFYFAFVFAIAHDDKCAQAFEGIFKNPLLNIITALGKKRVGYFGTSFFTYYSRACKWCGKVRALVYFIFSFPLFHMAHQWHLLKRSKLRWSFIACNRSLRAIIEYKT